MIVFGGGSHCSSKDKFITYNLDTRQTVPKFSTSRERGEAAMNTQVSVHQYWAETLCQKVNDIQFEN